MKKLLAVITAGALALCMSSGMAAHHNSKASSTKAAAQKAGKFLFVVSAKKGKLKKGPKGTTLLVIKKSDLDRTIMFSDRPQRQVYYIKDGNLAKDWTKGKNSFAIDPPNAVLSAANMKPQVVVVDGMQVSDNTVTMQLSTGAAHLPLKSMKGIVVTIDGSNVVGLIFDIIKAAIPFVEKLVDDAITHKPVF